MQSIPCPRRINNHEAIETFIAKLDEIVCARKSYMDNEEYAQSVDEVQFAYTIQNNISTIHELLDSICSVFGSYFNNPERCLMRIHEVSGVGALYSCLSSLPIVEAFFQLGLCGEKGVVDSQLIVGRGHIAPVFYSFRHVLGGFPLSFLMSVHELVPAVVNKKWGFANSMRHSLGEGLPMAVGRALKCSCRSRCYCFVGDGELNEGITFEAIRIAYENDLKNLTVIVDNNHTGIEALPKPLNISYLNSFFDNVVEIDGQDSGAVLKALQSSKHRGLRDVIVCHTEKNKHAYQRKDSNKTETTCASVAEIITEIKQTQKVHVFTADLAGRFGLSGYVDYLNVGLSEAASVAMTMALPQDEIKFVLTDDKYLLNSLDTIMSAMAHTSNLHIIAARKNIVWGGPVCVPNIFSAMVEADLEVYELVDPEHLRRIMLRAMCSGANGLYLMNDQDDSCLTGLRHGYKEAGDDILIKRHFLKDYLFVTAESAAPIVSKMCTDESRTHLRVLKRRPQLSASIIAEIMSYDNIVVVENNLAAGGLGEYIENILCRSVRKITSSEYEQPTKTNGMAAVVNVLYELQQELRFKNKVHPVNAYFEVWRS